MEDFVNIPNPFKTQPKPQPQTENIENSNLTNPSTNTSGMGKDAVVPEEVKGWSWGGFLWGWIWAISNRTWFGLLTLIPGLGFFIYIILGIYGKEWAWKNKKWDSIEAFKTSQKKWSNIFSFILFFIVLRSLTKMTANYLAYTKSGQKLSLNLYSLFYFKKGLPNSFKTKYLSSCKTTFSEETCQCSINYYETRYTFKELIKIMDNKDIVEDMFKKCLY
jgi:hypothetical protein